MLRYLTLDVTVVRDKSIPFSTIVSTYFQKNIFKIVKCRCNTRLHYLQFIPTNTSIMMSVSRRNFLIVSLILENQLYYVNKYLDLCKSL